MENLKFGRSMDHRKVPFCKHNNCTISLRSLCHSRHLSTLQTTIRVDARRIFFFFFGGNHKLYGRKVEVSVLPIDLPSFCTKSCAVSTSDLTTMREIARLPTIISKKNPLTQPLQSTKSVFRRITTHEHNFVKRAI